MAVVRKKQDDKYLVVLREMVTSCAGNRQCFDCGQKGPTYVNMTIGSFVCTRCSGVLRGLTPPHRVKSISMASFAQEDIDFLKVHGNKICAQTWLGLWDPKRVVHQDHRELMIDKYERKRYYLEPASPLKSLTNVANLKTSNYHTSNTTQHNGQNKQPSTNCYISNHLSPPASQRPAINVATAISRPHRDHQNDYLNHHKEQNDISLINNNLSLNSLSPLHNKDTTSSSILKTSSSASNAFNTDIDFVADFNSASIFNALSNSPQSLTVSSASNASSNVYAKVQPIKLAKQEKLDNGHVNNGGVISNGYATNNFNANENFADFDHAPIYNAAANCKYESNSTRNLGLPTPMSRIAKPTMKYAAFINTVNGWNNNNENNSMCVQENSILKSNNCYEDILLCERVRNLNDPFDDDFCVISSNNDDTHRFDASGDSTGWNNELQQTQHVEEKRQLKWQQFAPLALAAHATAMAVLSEDYQFNNNNNKKEINFQNDKWKNCCNHKLPDTCNNSVAHVICPKELSNCIQFKTNGGVEEHHTASNYDVLPIAEQMAYNSISSSIQQSSSSIYSMPAALTSNMSNQQTQMPCNQKDISNYDDIFCLSPSNPFLPQILQMKADVDVNHNSTISSHSVLPAFSPSSIDVVLQNSKSTDIVTVPDVDCTNNFYSCSINNEIVSNNATANATNYSNNSQHCDNTISWCLPMAMAMSNKIGTPVNTNNNKLPIEDRYAALKDLDEQLREIKALTDDKLNNANNCSNQNPFKNQQQLSSSPHQPNGSLINPFQAQNLCGQMAFIPNSYGTSPQQLQQQLQYAIINNNGGDKTNNNEANNLTYAPVVGAGCGFGGFAGLQHQQSIPVPGVGAGGINNGPYKNPFTTSVALNSNNPFL